METSCCFSLGSMMPLHMQIDSARCTAIPRPIHTLQAKEEPSFTAKSTHVSMESSYMQTSTTSFTSGATKGVQVALLQGVHMPAESVHFMQVVNPWPHHTICFESSLDLPLCLSSSPTLASGPSVSIAIHNLLMEPVTLHARHQMEAAKVVELSETMTCSAPMLLGGLVPDHLSPVQQHQKTQLLEQYRDIFSRDDDDDIELTPVLSKPLCLSIQSRCRGCLCSGRRLNKSNSGIRRPVVMVWKKDGKLRFCANFRHLNSVTVKDAHPLPCTDDLFDTLHGA